MKKLLFHSAFAISVLAIFLPNEPLSIGAALPHPDTKLKDIAGKEITLQSAMKKNGLLVMFSCNTCPVVKKYQARTLEVCNKAISTDIGVVLLNSNEATRDDGDSYDDMKSYASERGYQFTYAIDNNSVLADAFGAARTPEVFLFDKAGKLVYHGAIDDNPNSADAVGRKHLQMAIEELTAGKEIATKKTKSVGCGIKRR